MRAVRICATPWMVLALCCVPTLGACRDTGGPKAQDRTPLADYRAYDSTVDGAQQLEHAATQARSSGRRILVIFGGNWCRWCQALDQALASQPALRDQLQAAFVVVHIDADTNLALNARYGNPFRLGFPVLAVLGGAGELIHIQDSALLQRTADGFAYDTGRVLAFLRQWAPPA